MDSANRGTEKVDYLTINSWSHQWLFINYLEVPFFAWWHNEKIDSKHIPICFTHSINTAVDTGGHITMLSFWLQSSRECSTTWQSNFQHHRECMFCNESVSGNLQSFSELLKGFTLCERFVWKFDAPTKVFVQTFKSLLVAQWERNVYWNQSRHPIHPPKLFTLFHMSSIDGTFLVGFTWTRLISSFKFDCNFKSVWMLVGILDPVFSLIQSVKLEILVKTAFFVTSQSPFLTSDDDVMPSMNQTSPCST